MKSFQQAGTEVPHHLGIGSAILRTFLCLRVSNTAPHKVISEGKRRPMLQPMGSGTPALGKTVLHP